MAVSKKVLSSVSTKGQRRARRSERLRKTMSAQTRRTAHGKPAKHACVAKQRDSTAELAREVALLRESLVARPHQPAISETADELNALRRVLADIFESRMTSVLQKLAAIRQAVPLDITEICHRVDALLEDLGAIPFEAERCEHLDPVIHEVGKEVQDDQLPDGVIAISLRPGWRTVHGQVLARAVVSLNRRL